MTRCVYYRAYFHYARVFYSTCAFSRREIVCASGQLDDDASCVDLCPGFAWALLQFGFEVAPKSLRDFGGISFADGLSFAEVGCQTEQ